MKKYASIKDIVNDPKYPFGLGQLRALIFHRKKNGLSFCIRKIGKRVYIREDLFEEWIENQTDDCSKSDYTSVDQHNIAISEVEFSVRTTNCLNFAEIQSLNELSQKTESELLLVRNMGRRSVNEIKDKLNDYGLKLKGG